MAEPKNPRDGDSQQEEREHKARTARWASPKVRSRSDDFFENPSRETASHLKVQLEKELGLAGRFAFRPSLTPLWLIAYVAVGISLIFVSYLLIKHNIFRGSGGGYRGHPSVAASTLHPEISPDPKSALAKPDKRRKRKKVYRPQGSQASAIPSVTPSATETRTQHALICASCVVGGVSDTLNKAVQAVQGVLNPLEELPPELVQPVRQDVLGPLLAPGSATPTQVTNSPNSTAP